MVAALGDDELVGPSLRVVNPGADLSLEEPRTADADLDEAGTTEAETTQAGTTDPCCCAAMTVPCCWA